MSGHNLVKEFHETFGLPVLIEPQIPSEDRIELRKKLLREEVEEFCDALDEGNIAHAAKELADILYVAYGAGHEIGVDPEYVMELVHENNMTKVWDDGTVHYREDGKVLKPDNFKPLTDDDVSEHLFFYQFFI